jgi:epoxyqueuosine reductase QueG
MDLRTSQAARIRALRRGASGKIPELLKYPEWLERGYAGEMKYLSDPRRLDPRHAMSGVRSLIVCALNYNSRFPLLHRIGSGR